MDVVFLFEGEGPDTADPSCSSLTQPLRISHPNLNHVGLRREEKRGETEDGEGGRRGGGGRRESGSRGREEREQDLSATLSSAPPAQPPTQSHQEAFLLSRSLSNSGS